MMFRKTSEAATAAAAADDDVSPGSCDKKLFNYIICHLMNNHLSFSARPRPGPRSPVAAAIIIIYVGSPFY